jgi:hypothetical protein
MNLSRDGHAASGGAADSSLLFVGFNQDNGCFACGTSSGFVIYNVDPFRETFRRTFTSGGIGIVEMLFRCNLIAIVGGGRNPRYPTNKVMIWDDHQNKCIGELMFRSEVYAVRLRRDRVVVVLSSKVYVYRFSDLKLVDQINTVLNPKGLVSLCPDTANNVLAVPGLARGLIRIELYDISKATIIKAHDADLAQIALSADGARLASASDKGTLIRLWDCHTGDLLREFRRGMDRAEIYCLSFSPTAAYLACSSDKGTVHIFSLAAPVIAAGGNGEVAAAAGSSGDRARQDGGSADGGAGALGSERSPTRHVATVTSTSGAGGVPAGSVFRADSTPQATSSSSSSGGLVADPEGQLFGGTGAPSGTPNKSLGLAFLNKLVPKGMVPKYLNSEWSYAQVRGIEGKAICAFDRDSTKIVIVCADGTFISSAFADGGECQRLSTVRFFKSDAELEAAGLAHVGASGAGGTDDAGIGTHSDVATAAAAAAAERR